MFLPRSDNIKVLIKWMFTLKTFIMLMFSASCIYFLKIIYFLYNKAIFFLQFTPDNAAPYLVFLNFASFFIGVYGLVIFMKTTSKLLTGFHIKGKFLSLQLQFILVRFHFFTFDTFGRLGYFPCHPPVSSLMTALCKLQIFMLIATLLLY